MLVPKPPPLVCVLSRMILTSCVAAIALVQAGINGLGTVTPSNMALNMCPSALLS